MDGSTSTPIIAISLSAVMLSNSFGTSSLNVLASSPVLLMYLLSPMYNTLAVTSSVVSIPRLILSRSMIISPSTNVTCLVFVPIVTFNVPFIGLPSTSVTVTFNVTFPTVLLTIYTVVFVGILLDMNVVLLLVALITSSPLYDTVTV